MLLLLSACFQDSEPFFASSPGLEATDLCDTLPTGSVAFPDDFSAHSSPFERWRWQARLSDAESHEYFAQVEATWLSEATWQVSQALAIPETGAFMTSVQYFTGAEPGFDELAISLPGFSASGGQGTDTVALEADDWALDLSFMEGKAPMLFGGAGDMTFEAGSGLGYSWSRMNVTASLLTAANTTADPVSLSGRGHMEHSWGDLADVESSGWVRFALQLDDGRDLSIVYVPTQDQAIASATLSDALCWVSDVSESITVLPGASWTSTGSACSWPTAWTIEVGNESFEIDAPMFNQEISSASTQFWSGEVNIEGAGRGMVVATGCY